MRYHFFLHYWWFLQNFEKDFIPTLLHTTVYYQREIHKEKPVCTSLTKCIDFWCHIRGDSTLPPGVRKNYRKITEWNLWEKQNSSIKVSLFISMFSAKLKNIFFFLCQSIKWIYLLNTRLIFNPDQTIWYVGRTSFRAQQMINIFDFNDSKGPAEKWKTLTEKTQFSTIDDKKIINFLRYKI